MGDESYTAGYKVCVLDQGGTYDNSMSTTTWVATYDNNVCVNAANWASYTGGVMTSAQCGGFAYGDLDHCVQLTGYNSDEGYWAVRNSWSTDWGIDGYIRLEMADGVNPCGIANEATMTVLGDAKGDDKHGGGK